MELASVVAGIANRRPSVGLAVGVVRGGSLESFAAHGLAAISTGTPITADTVFRVASVTKVFTAVAVLQLWEQGLVDLDAPANEYLRTYRLVPARARFRPATVRQLLTHTAGIREVLHPLGLLRMRDLGETVPLGRPVPSLARWYRGRLSVDADPGTRFMYTNHGFATLGQIVADVSGQPLDVYLREHVLEPLDMRHSDLVRSDRVGPGLATGYELRSGGATEVPDYELIPVGAGGLYSTPRDMARFLAALLGGGRTSVLKPETVAMMFDAHYRPDPRIPGMGLAFFRADLGGRLAVEHDGILPGFDSQIFLAPDAGVAVMAFANGARRGLHWLTPEIGGIVRQILGVPEPGIRADVPHHPEIWGDLVGWYGFAAHRSDPARFAIGAGARVVVRSGQLMIRLLSPIPSLHKGFRLHPDDPSDPYVFRIELPWFGIGTTRVVFSRDASMAVNAMHVEVGPLSFAKHRREPR